MYDPMLARESTATMTPPSKMKPRVVVPWLGFTSSMTSRSKESGCCAKKHVDQHPRRTALRLSFKAWQEAPAARRVGRGGGGVDIIRTHIGHLWQREYCSICWWPGDVSAATAGLCSIG